MSLDLKVNSVGILVGAAALLQVFSWTCVRHANGNVDHPLWHIGVVFTSAASLACFGLAVKIGSLP